MVIGVALSVSIIILCLLGAIAFLFYKLIKNRKMLEVAKKELEELRSGFNKENLEFLHRLDNKDKFIEDQNEEILLKNSEIERLKLEVEKLQKEIDSLMIRVSDNIKNVKKLSALERQNEMLHWQNLELLNNEKKLLELDKLNKGLEKKIKEVENETVESCVESLQSAITKNAELTEKNKTLEKENKRLRARKIVKNIIDFGDDSVEKVNFNNMSVESDGSNDSGVSFNTEGGIPNSKLDTTSGKKNIFNMFKNPFSSDSRDKA